MKNIKIKINLQKLIFLIIYFSTIFFNGGVTYRVDIIALNSYYDLLFILFYLVAPLISYSILSNYFKNHFIQLTIRPLSTIIGIIVFLFILINNFKHDNLFSDEFYYTYGSFKVASAFLTQFRILEVSFLSNFSYSLLLRIILCIQWIGSFFLIRYIFSKHTFMTESKLYLVLLFTLKFVLIMMKTTFYTDAHPPMNYLASSLFITLFGLNTIAIKSSVIFVNTMFIIYLYNRLKLSAISAISISVLIYSLPVIIDFSNHFEQSIFSMFCFSVIIIEIYFKKISPSYLIFAISIFALFRYSSVAAYPAAFIYSYFYYNSEKKNWINTKKFFKSLTPIVLILPIVILPILIGTPATQEINNINIRFLNILNPPYLVFENIFNIFGSLLIIPSICFIYLTFFDQKNIVGYVFITCFSFHFILSMADVPKLLPKYSLEQIGFVFIFSFIYIIQKFYNSKILTKHFKLTLLTFSTLLFSFYNKNNLISNNYYKNIISLNFQNNSYDYLVDYINTKNLYDKSLLIGKDYGPLFLGLYNTTVSNFNKYRKNFGIYTSLMKKYNVEWTYIDPNTINEMEKITHLMISENIFSYNKKNINKLINLHNWEIIQDIEATNSFSNFYILQKINNSEKETL